jgi:hypothetical protein
VPKTARDVRRMRRQRFCGACLASAILVIVDAARRIVGAARCRIGVAWFVGTCMKAYVYQEKISLRDLHLVERPDPTPGPHDIVLRMRAAGDRAHLSGRSNRRSFRISAARRSLRQGCHDFMKIIVARDRRLRTLRTSRRSGSATSVIIGTFLRGRNRRSLLH